ncbi:MAG: trypsin-like peptidase domain-containing protein, partial [Pseudomonadota bacterium]
YVVTNNHVVENGSSYQVVLNDGTELDAKLVGTDPKTDLAVLKVDESQKFTYVSFAKKKSRVGEWVVAVGNPFGLGGTVTAGIVSASGRDIGSGPYDDFIQIDAAVNKGNSGGPAFNLNGEVIGVNTAIFSPSGGNVGIAFAISAATTEEVIADLIKSGSVTRGWLGVQIQPVTEDIAESLGLAQASGTIVAGVQDGSPAEKDGLRSGDVIQKVDGQDVKGPKELVRLIASYEPSETAKITVFRSGESVEVPVTLGKLPGAPTEVAMSQQGPSDGRPVDLDQLGLAIERGEDGVIVSDVMPGGAADEKGIQPGDVIVSINGKDTGSVNDVGAAVAAAMEDNRKSILLQVRRNDRNRFVAVPVERG